MTSNARTTRRCSGHSRASPAITTICCCALGLISEQDYLETLGRSITERDAHTGPCAADSDESSWDAWIKYYRQDENTPNSQVSYYLKGSLVALNLDLLIRHAHADASRSMT